MDLINPPNFKKAIYQERISKNISQCLTCERKCEISIGNSGFCQTRINLNGEIFSIVYGLIPALSFNPIEKKPLYHFYPGSVAITIGTYGCNFNCFWCQNHHISHPKEDIRNIVKNSKDYLTPEEIIKIARINNCQGTSISFNEPTLLFEYSLEVFKLAKKEGLYNTYVTNGYMTEEVLEDLIKNGLDAMNIDIKGEADMVKRYCGADVEKVWRNAKIAKESGVHIEITTLLIENLNTNQEIIKRIAQKILNDLGDDTPFHLTRFFPHYKSNEHELFDPTPKKILSQSYETSKEAGLKFVYLGNLPYSKYDNTYCNICSKLVIERSGLRVSKLYLDNHGNCKYCGSSICKI
ncbi:MAG: AmmeMemoRadiSam system radical SAM enzyme [Candidatus Odinarchaeota archaeon]